MSDDAHNQQAQVRAQGPRLARDGVTSASAGSSDAISATAGPDETRSDPATSAAETNAAETRAAETRAGREPTTAEETREAKARATETRETGAGQAQAAGTEAAETRVAETGAGRTRAASSGRADQPPAPSVSPMDEDPVGDTSMWLSHHWPADYDRCVVVAGRHVCRRCLVMYPIALLVALGWAALGPTWPRSLDRWLIPFLPLPAVVDLVAENLGWARYAPPRQMALTALGSVAAGVGFVRYVDRPGDPLVWGTVLVYGAVCVAASLAGHRRRGAPA